MKKILFFIVFIISVTLTNTAQGFFPEYENEIIKSGKFLIEKINKQSLSSDEEYLNSAKKIIESGKVKNIKDKNTLDDYHTLLAEHYESMIQKIGIMQIHQMQNQVGLGDEHKIFMDMHYIIQINSQKLHIFQRCKFEILFL